MARSHIHRVLTHKRKRVEKNLFAVKNGTDIVYNGDSNWYVFSSTKNDGPGYTYRIKNYNTGKAENVQGAEFKKKSKLTGKQPKVPLANHTMHGCYGSKAYAESILKETPGGFLKETKRGWCVLTPKNALKEK